ncbi:MAG: hypothetical protein GF317_06290 [Candidatus Lokiarchaeota archaeon]|nr:hypothetical protein [Candidatus Lokiarchaeota archaeon]MBD3199331.1 hypothetical protein [Candidatus Lokiarchaeota archaeon]
MEPVIHPNYRTNHPEWNESYYFCSYDKENEIGILSRLGLKPNKEEAMTFLFLFLPDGSAGGYFQEKKLKDFTDNLKVAGVTHGWREDGTWNYKFKGNVIIVDNPESLPDVRKNPDLISSIKKVKIDVNFNPLNDVYEYSKHMSPESLELGKKAGDKHWEQIAKINGIVNIDNQEFKIKNALGQRDHTYGVRDWTGVGNWLYYVIWFNDQLALNPAAIISEDGRLSTGGFLFRDGKNIPLKTIKILDQKFRDDGIFPVSSKLELIDDNSEKHILKAEVGPIIPVPFEDKEGKKSILVQSFGKFQLNEIKGGFGTFETLRKTSEQS